MKNSEKWSIAGVILTVIGAGVTLLSDIAASKQQSEEIKEEVRKAIAEQNSDEKS